MQVDQPAPPKWESITSMNPGLPCHFGTVTIVWHVAVLPAESLAW